IAALEDLRREYERYRNDDDFRAEFAYDMKHYVGRPSPIYHAKRWSAHIGGAQILLKREDLNHTGAHKINNAIGQALLAKRLGKARIIAETGAGQHGAATATAGAGAGPHGVAPPPACALLALPCRVFMGEVDVARQRPNVQRMELLGAE